MKKQIFTFFLLLSSFIGWAQELSVSPFHEDDHEGGLFAGGSVIYWNNTETKAPRCSFVPRWAGDSTRRGRLLRPAHRPAQSVGAEPVLGSPSIYLRYGKRQT